MIRCYELPVLRSIKMRSFEGTRPQDPRGVVTVEV
jgi:hypothetical protein